MAVRVLFFIYFISVSLSLLSQESVPFARELPARPFVFTSVSSTLEISQARLDQILNATIGDSIAVPFPLLDFNFIARAKVITAERTSINLQIQGSMPLLFTLTRTEENGGIRYTGRILHPNAGDALVLTQSDNKLYFVKIPTGKLLAD